MKKQFATLLTTVLVMSLFLNMLCVTLNIQLIEAQTVPNITCGVACDPHLRYTLIWTSDRLFGLANGNTVEEVTETIAGQKRSISGVQGIVYDPGGNHSLIWTSNKLFYHYFNSNTVEEVTETIAGQKRSISGVRGIVYDFSMITEDYENGTRTYIPYSGNHSLIWTSNKLFYHYFNSNTVEEVTETIAGQKRSISGVQGIVYQTLYLYGYKKETSNITCWLGNHSLIWTSNKLFYHYGDSKTVEEITETILEQKWSISGVQGIVSIIRGNREWERSLIWTSNKLFYHRGDSKTVEEITETILEQKRSISGVRGILPCLWNHSLIWTSNKLFYHYDDSKTVEEITETILGQKWSISGVQGIDSYGIRASGAWIWTSSKVFRLATGNTVEEITETIAGQKWSISGVQGIVNRLIWTSSKLFRLATGNTVEEVTETIAGQKWSISGVRGIDGSRYPWLLIWTSSKVFRLATGNTVEEVTETIAGQKWSISGVQGIVNRLIWTSSKLFRLGNTVEEIKSPEGWSIGSVPTWYSVQVVIHYIPRDIHAILGTFGAGVVGKPTLTPVKYTGSTWASAYVLSSSAATAHSTVIGYGVGINEALILGPEPVSGVVSLESMKIIGFRAPTGPTGGHGYYATYGSPETVDPHWAYDTASGELIQNVYEPLLMFDGVRTDAFIPMIADWWPGIDANPGRAITPIKPGWDGSSETWLFRIRTGVSWQKAMYGTVTAEDVVYSFKRGMLMDRSGGPMWMLYEPLLGVEYSYDYDLDEDGDLSETEYTALSTDVDKCIQTNGTHVWFNLYAGSYAPFQQILAQTWSGIMCKQWCIDQGLWKGYTNDYTDFKRCWDPQEPGPLMEDEPKAMGTGPYRLAAFGGLAETGPWYTLEAFDYYWRGWEGKHVEYVTVVNVPEWNNRKVQFLSTDPTLQVDFCDVPRACIPELHLGGDMDSPTLPGIRLIQPATPSQTLDCCFFNFKVAAGSPYMPKVGTVEKPDLFSDRHMRLALCYLFNATQYINDLFFGEAVQSGVCMPRGTRYYNASKPMYNINIARAQEQLDLAWGGEVKEKGLIMRLAYNIGNTARQKLCTMLAYGLQNLLTWGSGAVVDCQPLGVPWATYLPEMRAKKLLLFSVGWIADYPDPHNWFYPFMKSTGTYSSYRHVQYGLDPGSMNWAPGRMYGPTPYTNALGEKVTAINNTYIDHLIEEGIRIPDTDPRRNLIYNELMDIYYAEATQLPLVSASRRHYERTWVHGWYDTYNENPVAPGLYFYPIYKEPAGPVYSMDISATDTITNSTRVYPAVQVYDGEMRLDGKPARINYTVHVAYKAGTVDAWFLIALLRNGTDGTYYFPIIRTISLSPGEEYTEDVSWYEGDWTISEGDWTIGLFVSPIGVPGGEVEDTNLDDNKADNQYRVRTRIWKVDVDGSGSVNILDITAAAKSFGAQPGEERWDQRADIDGNGAVNILDMGKIAKYFQKRFTDVFGYYY